MGKGICRLGAWTSTVQNGGKFSKQTMGAEAFRPIIDLGFHFLYFICNKLITIDVKLGFNGMQCNYN